MENLCGINKKKSIYDNLLGKKKTRGKNTSQTNTDLILKKPKSEEIKKNISSENFHIDFSEENEDLIKDPKTKKNCFKKLKKNMMFYLLNYFEKHEVKKIRNMPLSRKIRNFVDIYIGEAAIELKFEKNYYNNFNDYMRVFTYKTMENNKHSFENLINFSCFKNALENFIIIYKKIHINNSYFPELIYIHENDIIVFKNSTSKILLKEKISENNNDDYQVVYEGQKREFLHSFKRLTYPNNILISCFFLTNLKILNIKDKTLILSINEDIIDMTYNLFSNHFIAMSHSKLYVFEEKETKEALKYYMESRTEQSIKEFNLKKTDLINSKKFSISRGDKENFSLYHNSETTKQENLNDCPFIIDRTNHLDIIKNLITVTDKNKKFFIQKVHKISILLELETGLNQSMIIEEINNKNGQIFCGYNFKNKSIFVFEKLNKTSIPISLQFKLNELHGHEGEIVNAKKHEKYSKKNNILLSLCTKNIFIIWNLNDKNILKKIQINPLITELNFFIFDINILRNDTIFLFTNEFNRIKMFNFNTGNIKDLTLNSTIINDKNQHKFLISHDNHSMNVIEISTFNNFHISKYNFLLKENFKC